MNFTRFINSLDYSLDLDKMRRVHKSLFPTSDMNQLETVFSFDDQERVYRENDSKGKEYSCQVINVTFKYSNKEFNRIRDCYYIRFGYHIDNLKFEDCIARYNGNIVGVKTGEYVLNPVDEKELEYFTVKDGKYCIKDNILTRTSVADIRSDIYENGFICEGIKYVRFKRSSGSSRVGKCLFINEKLYDMMREWEMCGIRIDEGQDIDLASLESYIALTLSSITGVIEIKPENILVINDYNSVFRERAIATRLVDGRLVSKPEDVEISNSIWDGQSLLDHNLFGFYADRGMLLLRGRFFKSCCFNANIQRWFADNGITRVEQLNGYTRAKRIEDVKLITTPSSIKYLKFGTLDQWFDNLEPIFGVVKHEKKTHFFDGRMVHTHYQLINTLQMTYEEMERFLKPSLDYVKMIKTDPAVLRRQIGYHYQNCDDKFYKQAVVSKHDIVYRLLGMNDRFAKTKIYRDFRNDLIKSFIKNLRCGHVLVHGNYSVLCGNPIEMLKMAIGRFNGDSIIEKNTVHCEMFENGKELLGSRSPHVTMGNILVTRNVIRSEISQYMNPTNEIVYVNSIGENLLERLSGADFDSDAMLLTDNEILVTAAKRNYNHFPVPTKLIKSAMRKRKYTNEEKADLDLKTSVNKIGEIINFSQELNSILWDRINKGADIDDVMELYCDISQLDVMSNLEIDAAKRENPANNTFELRELKKKYDIRDEKNRHIRPLFFKYIDGYKGYRNDYYVYVEDDGDFQKLYKTDKWKEAKEIKEQSENHIIIERGRMSYRAYETSMDYLQKCMNRFYLPRDEETNRGLSYILIPIGLTKGTYREDLEREIVETARKAKREINSIWEQTGIDKRMKRELTYDIQKKCAMALREIPVNEKTMRKLLGELESKYSDISRFLFFSLLRQTRGFMISCFYQIIQKSVSPVSVLREDAGGDIRIYDFRYLKTWGESGDYDLNYEHWEDFADEVREFMNKYGVRNDWLAAQLGINIAVFSRFLNKKKNLSKSNSFNLTSFIKQYKNNMDWLHLS